MAMLEKLSLIQQQLKAPKSMYNSFGKYKYRNAESILEAFKPYESKYNVALIVGDDIVQVGDRFYVKATATFFDCESGEKIENSAFAREDPDKKGMDGSQVTGSSSSYARKYALNGLLLLDDTQDADTDEYTMQTTSFIGPEQKAKILEELNRTGVSRKSLCASYGISSLDAMKADDFENAIEKLKKYPDREAKK